MQVRARDVRQVDAPDDAHALLLGARARGVEVLEIEQHHVAAVAAVALQIAPRRRVRPRRRDDLQEAVAEREHGVAQAELRHARVAKGLVQPERVAQLALDGVEIGGDEHGLAQADAWRWLAHACSLSMRALRGAWSAVAGGRCS